MENYITPLTFTGKRPTSLVFIDRMNYNNLQDAYFTNENIAEIPYKNFLNISLLTKASIVHLNRELNKLIYFSQLTDAYYDSIMLLNSQERQYITDMFKDTMYSNVYSSRKYYEIVILPNSTLLIVVDNGFLTFVTESKDNFLQFILDCLCYQYKFNLSGCLLKTYIGLKLNDTYFNLIKSRFN